jgi:anti-sigma regulatory factor (Ser/Thr protein kinase)
VAGGWHHEAVFYDGGATYVECLLPALREAIARDAAIMVAVAPDRIGRLTEALGADADHIRFLDMRRIGRNPARIIPEWQAFADAAAGRPVLGIGEPVWPGRTTDELQECELHEALLNVAFADAAGFRLLCPYDRSRLPDRVLDGARATHPVIDEGTGACASGCYHHDLPLPALSAAPGEARRIVFDGQTLCDVRRAVADEAALLDFADAQRDTAVLAVNELAANSVRHGGGHGEVHVWRDGDELICEVRDAGAIGDQLAGRRRPDLEQLGGRGLWMVNQLCDLVQIRTPPASAVNTVRVRIRAERPAELAVTSVGRESLAPVGS